MTDINLGIGKVLPKLFVLIHLLSYSHSLKERKIKNIFTRQNFLFFQTFLWFSVCKHWLKEKRKEKGILCINMNISVMFFFLVIFFTIFLSFFLLSFHSWDFFFFLFEFSYICYIFMSISIVDTRRTGYISLLLNLQFPRAFLLFREWIFPMYLYTVYIFSSIKYINCI